jgi:dTDP-4-amino-4,6-dideoxygalactose transaminase
MVRPITLGTLNISQKGKDYVNDALNNNRLSKGPFTDKFEKEFARLHQSKHGIFLNSGTSALQVALAALKEVHGYQDGDEVLVPATTFIATSNIVLQNNLKPVFVDVHPLTYNMDPEKIQEKITSRTRAIIPVHLFGLPADMITIQSIASDNDLQVIEDSCETMFATTNGRSVGSFGHLSCFSTYVAHLIVGGVGGLVLTDDDKLAEICKSLMAHGRDSIYTSIDDDDNVGGGLQNIIERRYKFDRVGYSYRATELEAAIALSELERWEENIICRRQNAAYLTSLLRDEDNILQLPYIPENYTHSFMMYPMVLSSHLDRDKLLLLLEERGIETRYMFPLLSQPVYRRLFPSLEDEYPVAQRLAKQGFFIGMHQGLVKEDLDYVSEVIHEYNPVYR